MTTDSRQSDHLWFLDTLVIIRVSHREGSDGISILEHSAPHGDSPPLHIHLNEDEMFYVLEGEFQFRLNGEGRRLKAGEGLLAPKGTPHTYRVQSRIGRWITVTAHRQFEDFVPVWN
jgi:quercetin dioxygenase-like cupin family protein